MRGSPIKCLTFPASFRRARRNTLWTSLYSRQQLVREGESVSPIGEVPRASEQLNLEDAGQRAVSLLSLGLLTQAAPRMEYFFIKTSDPSP